MGQIFRKLAVVGDRFIVLFGMLLLLTILAGCGGSEDEAGQESQSEQLAAEEPASLYLQLTDSLRWQGYLAFSPADTALAYVMLAALYLSNRYPEAALHYLEVAGTHDLDRPVIYLNIGYAYSMMGDYDKASEAFHMFVQRDPGSILSQEIFRIEEKFRALANQPPEIGRAHV